MTAPEVLDRLRLHLSGHSRDTLDECLIVARRFSAAHPDPSTWSLDLALGFINELRAEKKASSTIRRYGQALRKLYEVAGLEKPTLHTPLTAWDVINMQAPQLSREELDALIVASCATPWPEDAGLVALATIYGFRQKELRILRAEDIDVDHSVIRIATAKGNPPRIHRLPEMLPGLLQREWFAQPRSETDMWGRWHDLERRAKIPPRQRQGWHSIRRGLLALLEEAGLPMSSVEAWMGYAARSTGRQYAMRRSHALDNLILGRHPLVATWAKVLADRGGEA